MLVRSGLGCITDLSSKLAYTLHFYLRNQIAAVIGITVSSLLFWIIPVALTSLTRSKNRSERYIGYGGLGALLVMAALWGTLPRVI